MEKLKRLAGHLGAGAMNWHALRLYRLSSRLFAAGHPTTGMIVAAVNRVLTGVEIHPQARFGPGLIIMHGTGIVVHPGTRVGSDCVIYQGVTLGSRAHDGKPPTLGDRVTMFPGAKVLGDIVIGDDVRIGPNAVVIASLPAGATALAPLAVARNAQDSDGEDPRGDSGAAGSVGA